MVLLTKGRTVDESRTELGRQDIRGGSKFVIHPYPEHQTYEHTGRLYIYSVANDIHTEWDQSGKFLCYHGSACYVL